MPRRPRPSARKPPKSITPQDNLKPSAISDSESDGIDVLGLDDDNDADAPRIAQWVDEDDFVEPEQPQAGPSKLDFLKNNLSNLPMGALRHAQNVLGDPNEPSDSDDSASIEGEGDTGGYNIASERTQKRSGGDVSKRSNKHAPVEISSKQPVTRRRMVVDVQTPEVRDPRFLPMTGSLSAEKFQANYSFLGRNHETELATLRETLKRARKLLSSSPRDLRVDREAEVQRLELAVKRAESAVSRDRQQQAERDALMTAKKEEREKRKEGKGNWWMKKSAKKELLVKARYEALAADGGQRAVKKAMEKKRKKIGQKEKRSRPFPKGGSGFEAPERAHKRRKIE